MILYWAVMQVNLTHVIIYNISWYMYREYARILMRETATHNLFQLARRFANHRRGTKTGSI